MCPERAIVSVFEDNKGFREVTRDFLELDEHSVVLEASTLKEALEAVKRFGELGVQVAIIDDNLTPYTDTGDDAKCILAAIRAIAPTVKTVGMGRDLIPGVDVNVRKDNPGTFADIVTNL